jgi:hypothetical protein
VRAHSSSRGGADVSVCRCRAMDQRHLHLYRSNPRPNPSCWPFSAPGLSRPVPAPPCPRRGTTRTSRMVTCAVITTDSSLTPPTLHRFRTPFPPRSLPYLPILRPTSHRTLPHLACPALNRSTESHRLWVARTSSAPSRHGPTSLIIGIRRTVSRQ